MNTPDTLGGRAVLTLAHIVGMIDMVALPLWVGALMQYHHFRPAIAGVTVTLFLLGALVASVVCAPLFNRLPSRWTTFAGFAVAATSFALVTRWPMAPSSFVQVAVCHVVAGLGVGAALSLTHGCIGRSANPHRLFGLVNVVLGLFALVFLGAMPKWIAEGGSVMLFDAFSLLMAFAGLVALIGFPQIPGKQAQFHRTNTGHAPNPARLLVGVVVCLTLTQAMVFSFMERIGVTRGFSPDQIHGVLISLGMTNLLPGLLAAALQRRLSPFAVGVAGPLVQAALALTLSNSAGFWPYAVASAMFVSVVIFTHTFLFGLVTKLDSSGRIAAATPAMTMTGACIGPALGGMVVQRMGYEGLGVMACVIAIMAVALMSRVRSQVQSATALTGLQA